MPLYFNGARMTYFSAIMPISDGMGLVFAVTSYDGKIIISPTSCREQIPDPEFFALCIRESFQEYLELASKPTAAAQARPARRKARRSARRRRRRVGATAAHRRLTRAPQPAAGQAACHQAPRQRS